MKKTLPRICGWVMVSGCGFGFYCPPTTYSTQISPGRKYRAAVQVSECGPMVPFNQFIELSDEQGERRATIAGVWEAAIGLRPTWLSDAELEITFDCPTDDAEAACAPARDRHWSVTKTSAWRDVRITYQTAARLPSPLERG